MLARPRLGGGSPEILGAWSPEALAVARQDVATLRGRAPFPLNCGSCIGCLLDRCRSWAVRMTHEARMHEASSFLTITYDEDHLPEGSNLAPRDAQLFVKRLRKSLGRQPGELRYFLCGEYGGVTGRPHYHVALFGEDFRDDRRHYKRTRQGHDLFTSGRLDAIWGKGLCQIGDLTFESAGYIARYVTKKLPSNKFRVPYGFRSDALGAERWLRKRRSMFAGREPEFVRMSLKPGIGATFFAKYKDEIYPRDFVVANGVPQKPPKYYDRLLERCDPELFERVKQARLEKGYEEPETLERQYSRSKMRWLVTLDAKRGGDEG